MATRIKILTSLAICAALVLVLLPFTAADGGGGAKGAAPFDYKKALHSSLLYFEAQRSGHLPHNQRVKWRGHSGLADGLQQGVDLVGGYYDAGDNVKFGLPMAFTVTMLSWSAMEFADDIAAAGEWRHVLEAIKWGTDYFVKAHTEPYVLWAEVGDGDTDHYCWQRPEDMTTSRQAYKVDSDNPGSDLVGETAAALAAASMVFRRSNPHYAQVLLHHAEQLFEFGDKYRGKYDSSIGEAYSYYASVSGYGDEMLWAALWLHRATGKASYLDYAVDMADEFGGTTWAITEFSWDVKYAGLQILATKVLLEGKHPEHKATLEKYKAKAEHYLCACLNKNGDAGNVNRTAGGMLFVRQWNNMQYVTNAAFLLTVYSRYLTSAGQELPVLQCPDGPGHADELRALGRAQTDYVLGANPAGVSYLVGFIGCMQGYDNWFLRRGSNPNVVVGAIVGGPDHLDRFRDRRDNYMQTEACTYNTAPMVGIFAHLHGETAITEKS
ncbi:endoglucanase 21 [Triticum aestivum]|uniref:endoglucanase 21 n=1 Tax=Triticum aestivum TaxID=4565 RepID=UPI001D02B2CC|nr:endoglucanase 21-like [Triticum aestivum]